MVDVALLAVIAIGLAGVVLGRGLPAVGHPVFVVAGPSMETAIGVGAAVVLEAVPPAALRVGDVVSLQSGPSRAVFTHRITRIAEHDGTLWLETKGDANAKADPSMTPVSAVIGRVAVTLPMAGYLLTVLSAPAGVLFILSTGALLILLGWWLDSVARERSRAPGTPDVVPATAPGLAPALAAVSSLRASRPASRRLSTGDGSRPKPRRATRPSPGMRRA